MKSASRAAVAGVVLAAIALATVVVVWTAPRPSRADPQAGLEGTTTVTETAPGRPAGTPPAPAPQPAAIPWRQSRAIGLPYAGRLVNGVRLPSEGEHFFTWDPVLKRSPNRPWRRWGTDGLLRTTLRVIRQFAAAHPNAPRVGVGDLSRPRGGDFGPRFGGIGHASHQNGLDVDVYYPRLDRRERSPRRAAQVDRALAQDLVDRFVAAGAVRVFVGPNVRLTGPSRVVQPLANHDNHLHVRLPRSRA
jgi:murein endopeptidase